MAGLLMRRVPRVELVNNFSSALRDQPEFKAKGAAVLHAGMRVEAIANRLAGLIDSACVMTIATDVIDDRGTPGRWGQDEPDPAGRPRPPRKVI